jgi:4-amino-4-deoxy-L-arabinose transferase-like glycosyltransferase
MREAAGMTPNDMIPSHSPSLPRALAAIETAAGRLRASLADPVHGNRRMVLTLVLYTLAWALYGIIAKSGQDVHPDMTELVVWAREPALGYFKHPPFAAWLTAAWFSAFPVADWSYYLLAAAVPSAALWIVWRGSADYLDAGHRVAGIALLTLTPFFGVLALKFNVNTVLLPLWAATAVCFLRSFERRSILWAGLAGICAAAAMLTKYWSIFLVAGLVLAALGDRRRWTYLRSAAPWITVTIGALALAPHVVWLFQNDFPPFHYVSAAHQPATLVESAGSAVTYLLGSAGYVALPVILVLAAARPGRATLRDLLWPRHGDRAPQRRLVARAFWWPLVLPAFAAIAVAIEITSIWSMSAFALLPVVLLASPLMTLPRQAVDRIVALAVAVPLIMLIASPIVAAVIQRGGLPADQTQGSLVAPAVEAAWRAATPAPLRTVAGDNAYGIAFYLQDKPSAFPEFSTRIAMWIDEARLARDGMAMVCGADNATCLAEAQRRAAAAHAAAPVELTVARTLFGIAGPARHYRIWALPPK